MKIDLDDDTIARLRRCSEGLTHARYWVMGYRAAGGHIPWGDSINDAQVIIDVILQQIGVSHETEDY